MLFFKFYLTSAFRIFSSEKYERNDFKPGYKGAPRGKKARNLLMFWNTLSHFVLLIYILYTYNVPKDNKPSLAN